MAGVALSMTGCSPVYSYRFRLTFEFIVDGRTVIGAGVWKESASLGSAFPNGSIVHSGLNGDAISIDLGRPGMIFVILSGFNGRVTTDRLYHVSLSDWEPNRAFKPYLSAALGPRRPETYRELRERLPGRKIELDLDYLPAFVSFRDRNDPNSGFLIAARDFAAVFGPGVALQRATIELTDDPVTRGISNQLPWVAKRKRNLLDATSMNSADGRFTPNIPYFSR